MESLNLRLTSSISQLSELARTSKIISINVALLAEQIETDRAGSTAAIKVVALEIQRLSDKSNAGLAKLHHIVDDLRLLTQTINLAGRQRMLSQRIMKLFLIRKTGSAPPTSAEFDQAAAEFARALGQLTNCSLNTATISSHLADVTATWNLFFASLQRDDLGASIRLNEQVLHEIHATVQAYEELAGHKALASSETVSAPSGRWSSRAVESLPASHTPDRGVLCRTDGH